MGTIIMSVYAFNMITDFGEEHPETIQDLVQYFKDLGEIRMISTEHINGEMTVEEATRFVEEGQKQIKVRTKS